MSRLLHASKFVTGQAMTIRWKLLSTCISSKHSNAATGPAASQPLCGSPSLPRMKLEAALCRISEVEAASFSGLNCTRRACLHQGTSGSVLRNSTLQGIPVLEHSTSELHCAVMPLDWLGNSTSSQHTLSLKLPFAQLGGRGASITCQFHTNFIYQ
jgi:hypothetical protein